MSLFSAWILPHLEKELITMEPQVAQFLLTQLKKSATEVVAWTESKIGADINGDGKIGITN